jgi:Tol biopolymer transport system component
LLPSEFTQDRQRLHRFKQEARAASALNHPNILTIHEIGQIEDTHFIATEFIEGETLREVLGHDRMKLDEVMEVAIQVSSALGVAHEAGIIHRDIKPENIMVRRDGYVKVLDFGLAKLMEKSGAAHHTTLTTDTGLVIGTASYMSPEQALGRAVDQRTDLFSLGVVLYEMTTGRRPFSGNTTGEMLDAIVHAEPESVARFNSDAPAELQRIISKCLAKDLERRYQTAQELLTDLKNLRRALESGVIRHRRYLLLAGLALVVLALVGGGFYLFASMTKEAAPSWSNATHTRLTDQPGEELYPSLSPNGDIVVYASGAWGQRDIYVQRVGGKNPINLTPNSPVEDTHPAFSPDGQRIAFRSDRDGGGIFIMGATGENIKRLTDFGYHPAWSPDGREILCVAENLFIPIRQATVPSPLWSVNVATGQKRVVTNDAVQPQWSPHGRRIAYWAFTGGRRDIWTIPASGGEPVPVTNDTFVDWNPTWSPDGKYLYFVSDRSGSMNLWRVPIDEASGHVLGPPEPVTTPSVYSQHISFSRDGRHLAYVQVINRSNIQKVGFDPEKETVTGQPLWITRGSMNTNMPNLSPDGEWLVFSSFGEQQVNLFISRADGTGQRQLTEGRSDDRSPRWSPDGQRIAFFSKRSGNNEIWLINPDGSGLQQLTYTSAPVCCPIWSPDGRRLVYSITGGKQSFIMDVDKPWREQTPEALPPAPGPFLPQSWSSDGRKLAAGTGGRGGIFIYTFETRQYEKLKDSGAYPLWLNDNRRLLFYDGQTLFLMDSQTKRVREVLNVSPNRVEYTTLSRDNRWIYYTLVSAESDLWLMSLK